MSRQERVRKTTFFHAKKVAAISIKNASRLSPSNGFCGENGKCLGFVRILLSLLSLPGDAHEAGGEDSGRTQILNKILDSQNLEEIPI